MSKVIEIKGKEYRRKYVSQIVVNKRCGVLVRNKELFAFNDGLIYVRLSNGTNQKFYVGRNENNNIGMMFYDCGVNKEQSICFSDEVIDRNWSTVFVYLFDEEEGAYMLFAERSTMNAIGALYKAEAGCALAVKQMALNIASLIDSALLYEILDMEQMSEEREMSLITQIVGE